MRNFGIGYFACSHREHRWDYIWTQLHQNTLSQKRNANFQLSLSWHALKHFKTVGELWGILELGILHVLTGSIGEIIYEPSFTKIHSLKKEMQLSNFLEEWNFVILQVLKHLSNARKIRTILEWVFSILLPRALLKWRTLQSSSIYTLPLYVCPNLHSRTELTDLQKNRDE